MLNMVTKRHGISLSTLLILVLVVYTLVSAKNTIFAQESNKSGNVASVEVSANVDKNEVTIGDKIRFGIRVKYKDEITIQFPELNEQLGAFTVKNICSNEVPKREKDGYSIIERVYVLSSYEIGRQTVTSLKIKYKGVRGEGEVATNGIAVEVKGVIKEGEVLADIKDIHPPLNVPANFRRLVAWIFAGIGVLLAAGIAYWLINKRKIGQNRHGHKFTKRTPHEVAYELLERLLKENLVSKGLVKEYYYRITNVLRHYIEDRFGLLAPERTTDEFLIEMAHTNKLDDTHKELVREFLERCDMVKYAKYGPSVLEIKETYEAARRFIDETKECIEEKEVVAQTK